MFEAGEHFSPKRSSAVPLFLSTRPVPRIIASGIAPARPQKFPIVFAKGDSAFGSTSDVAKASGILLIGVDAGVDGDKIPDLEAIGAELSKKEKPKVIREVIDRVCASVALRIIDICNKKGLLPPNSSIGFTGRAIISGNKPQYILEGVAERNIYNDPVNHLVFVDDGLARGSALMGRCMNSIGHPKCPIGGVRDGKCIMAKRIKVGK